MTVNGTAPAPNGISASAYSVKRRQLVSLVDQLRSAGASTEIDLPRIAVIGNQSAGKSSLVEAISGIKVPRDAGTCTRCPMEIRLRSSPGEWTCRVFLRFETDVSGRPTESVREVPFGDAVTSPDAVEAILRRAQLAILNPHDADEEDFTSKYIGLSDEQVKGTKERPPPGQLSFSRNLICIDVTGPVTDLTSSTCRCGIISHSTRDKKEIPFVEEMVREAITGNCLILLTISMRDDLENQKAVSLANDADPEGKRTIGILTKADLNSYFVTKQPAPEDLKRKLTYQDAREAEKQYFATAEPCVPCMDSNIAGLLAKVTSSLSELPAPPSSDAVTDVHSRISTLSHDLDLLVRGSPGYVELVQAKTREDRRFKLMVRRTEPVFVPFEAEEEMDIENWREKRASLRKNGSSEDVAGVLDMTLDELRTHIEKHRGREVPLNTPYDAKASLMTRATAPWATLVWDALERMRTPVITSVTNLVERQFGASLSQELTLLTSTTMSDVVDDLFSTASFRLADLLELETIPYTQNQHYFITVRDAVLAGLREARREGRANGAPGPPKDVDEDDLSDALASLVRVGYRGVKEEDLPKLLPGDVYEEELEAAAQTVTYWKVAYKRIIDDVPRIIDFSIIRRLPSTITQALLKRLISAGDSEPRRLISESPEVAEERTELNVRKKRLEEAKKVLDAFRRSV
ncbi:P-loop containing nucleoside triphosphate hydrolase protein [Rhodotorula toruloides]|uniref:P-loop containing nucleoside triphosphate hydrolase protein n=1 Tax=Rhodotorula toruloides TaxID=5286 RepID=A0A2T0A9E5_RHOTO|nr:P-loop containing nucleoside triphosphate hydrolase protein [Rhodotorula toruloides]